MKKVPHTFLFRYRLEPILGSDRLANVALRRPGEILTARCGRRYLVQDNGSLRRLAADLVSH